MAFQVYCLILQKIVVFFLSFLPEYVQFNNFKIPIESGSRGANFREEIFLGWQYSEGQSSWMGIFREVFFLGKQYSGGIFTRMVTFLGANS